MKGRESVRAVLFVGSLVISLPLFAPTQRPAVDLPVVQVSTRQMAFPLPVDVPTAVLPQQKMSAIAGPLLPSPTRSPARRRSRSPRPVAVDVVPEQPIGLRPVTPAARKAIRMTELEDIPIAKVFGEEPVVQMGGEILGQRGRVELPPSPQLQQRRELRKLLLGEPVVQPEQPNVSLGRISPVAQPGASQRGTMVYGSPGEPQAVPAETKVYRAGEAKAIAADLPEGARLVRIPGQANPVVVLPPQGPGHILPAPAETVVAPQLAHQASAHGGMGAYPEGPGTLPLAPAETVVAPQPVRQAPAYGGMGAYPEGAGTLPLEPAKRAVAPQPARQAFPAGVVEQRIIWNPKAQMPPTPAPKKKGLLSRVFGGS